MKLDQKIIALFWTGIFLFGLTYFLTAPGTVEAQSPVFMYGRDGGAAPLVVSVTADGAAAAPNLVQVGGTDGTNAQTLFTTSDGNLRIVIVDDGGTQVVAVTPQGDNVGTGTITAHVAAHNLIFDGANSDREFYCNTSTVVTVAAGATTEIVALVSADIIRVCGFVLSMDTTGTFQWVEGTGTDCGTGASDLTSDIDLVAGNAFSAYANQEIFRTTVSEALCLTAVTGAVDGVVTFAQY